MGFVGSVVKMVTGKPLVITTHGRDVYVDPEAGAIVPSLWYVRPFLQFALRRADRVIAVSQDCRHCAIRVGAPSERVEVIHNGVDAKRFSPNRVDGAGIRERIGVPDSAKLILFVGSLRSYKGIDILVQAMPRILESEPSAVTVVVGEGSQRETLVELKNSLGLEKRVVFVGRVPNWELAYYENACDVLVLPSRRESFGIAAVEAMACAKPVVGTRVGGLREIIDHGETGLLIDPDEPEELAESIVQVLGDRALAERLGSKARRKVEAKFNWLSAGLRTAVLYREILERTASND
jgi:glycosyltransferase involved in cell wall biosynthesis